MRKLLRLSTLLLLAVVCGKVSYSQDFSNKGKEFWLAYSYHVGMNGNNPTMTLYITSDVTTTYSVEIFGVTTLATGTINANQVVPVVIPNSYFIYGDGTFTGRAIRVTAAKPVVVYSFITRSQASAASLCLPLNVLGKEYYGISYTQVSNEANSNSYITIVAVEDNTTVDITPTATTVGGWAPNSTHTVTLNKGQVYQVLGITSGTTGVDLTGTHVQSVAGASGGCKRIAVFSGSGKLSISTPGCSAGSADNLYQQLYPVAAWGKKYMTAPSVNKPNNYYRIQRSSTTANVYLNGNLIPAGSFINNFYEFYNNRPNMIEADTSICVSQYFTSQNCPTGPGGNPSPYDPDMIVLNPVEQNINKVTLVNSPLTVTGAQQHNIHVVMRTGGTSQSSFRFDGNTVPLANWTAHQSDPAYSILYLSNVTQGNHTLYSDSGFNAVAYGYGNAETYGYSAGTNVKDIYQYMSVANQDATVNFPATCKNSPFHFSMTFPYEPTSIQWVFGAALNALGIADVTIPSPAYTSTTVVNGRTLYLYQLPTLYQVSAVGTYPIKVIATNPTADGCGGVQEIDFDLQVFNAPIADFNFTTNGCVSTPVLFADNSNTDGRAINTRFWNFGDAQTSTVASPAHLYPGPGSFQVKYTITTDIGCRADTVIKTVVMSDPPVAGFQPATAACAGQDLTFNDQSTAPSGSTLAQWTWNFGDGSPEVVRNSSTNETHRFNTAGTYNVTLLVVTSSGCASQLFTLPVTVHPSPAADFSLPAAVCLPSGSATFSDLSVSSGTGNAINTWSWNFGDAGTSAQQNPVHIYSSTGPFNVSLTVTTVNGCSDTRTQQLTAVYPEPVAAFNSLPEVCIGSLIGFSDASTASGSTVNGWTWNFGDGSPVSNVQNPTHTYNSAGTYTVTLSVTSAAGCPTVNNVATHSMLVKPLPTASISGNNTVCLNAASPAVTFTGAGGTAPFHFSYSVNGGPTQIAVAASSNTTTVPVPTGTSGTFVYTLQNVQESATTGCQQNQNGNVTIIVNPLPTALISGTTTVCQNSASPSITFTAANGSAPYTFTYNINGGAPQSVSSATNTVTVPVPTGTAGTFIYNLLTVQEGSANLCQQAQSGSATVTVNALPTATISGTTEVCLNAPSPSVTFTGAGGNAPYTFRYTINNGPIQTVYSTGNSITVPVPTTTAGTFVYALVDVKEGGAQACAQNQTGSATVIVNPLPVADFNYTIPSCETRDISFTDASVPNAGNLVNWQWNFGDPASNASNTSAIQNPLHNFTTAGSYTVSLVTTSDKGCVSPVIFKTLVVNNRPLAGFIAPEVCMTDANAPFIDTSKVTGSTITAWQWNFGDANANAGNPNTSVLQNPTHHFTVVGSYTATLIATSATGCKDTIQHSFVVNGSIPVAGFTVQNANALCSNQDVIVKDASTVDFGSIIKVEIYWDYLNNPADKTTIDNPVPGDSYMHTYPEFGTPATKSYQVRYVAYSGINCVNTSVQTITLLATPAIQFNPIPYVCSGTPAFQITQASLLNTISGTGVFSGNGVSSTGIFDPAVGAGQYPIRYTFTAANGCSNFKVQDMNVYITPAVNAGPDKFVLEGGQVTLTPALNANVPVTYQWTPPVSLNDPTISFPVASPVADITYTLTVTSPQGCSASDAVFVKVLKAPSVPNIFSPNGDGIHDRWVIPYLESYPGCTVDVVNRYGQPVFHSVGYATSWDGKVNGKDAPVGTYYYVIDPKNGRSKMTGYVDIIR